ncbi:MAG: hypothetical protein LBS09_09780 [Bacteroidales bacterium]|nr:hypothetical protein [Bacteroidales bacterium]
MESIVVENGSTAEAVDLRLSIKWASHNVGATKSEDYGTYFGWGYVDDLWRHYGFAIRPVTD